MSRPVLSSVFVVGATMLVWALPVTPRAATPLELRVPGYFYTEPASVQVTVSVEPESANRMLRIEMDGDRMFRSTDIALDGADDVKLHTIRFRNLPSGMYTVRARLLATNDREIASAQQELEVAR